MISPTSNVCSKATATERAVSDDLIVPEGWSPTTLGQLGRYLNGHAFKTSEWSKTGRPIIRIQDLTGSNRNPNYFDGEVEDRYVVRPGDFLISWSATLGAYIWDGPEAVLNQHIFKVESTIDKRFHYHLVRERIAELERNAHGSGMVHVTKGIFDRTPVAVPDDPVVQRLLADVIDRADTLHGSSAAHLAVARRAVERFRKAVLAAACSGRLTADWRDAHPEAVATVSTVTPSRKRRSAEAEPLDLDLPELPATYVLTTIGTTAVILEYGTSKKADNDTTGVPILRMGNIQDGRLALDDLKYCTTDREIERLILQDGDLLFNRTNSPELVGKAAVFHELESMTFASYLIRVRFTPEVADPDFVNYWVNSAWGRAWARHVKTDGVSQSNINGTKLGAMPLPLPPIAEQREIIRRSEALLDNAKRLTTAIDAASKRIDRSSQAVLAKAFRGELIGAG